MHLAVHITRPSLGNSFAVVLGHRAPSEEPKTLLNQMLGVDEWVDIRIGLHRIIASISRSFGDAKKLYQRRCLSLAANGFGVFDMGDVPGVGKHIFHVLRIE